MVVTHKDVAKLLADNKIIAIFQVASESGPRALGNRSILHNPSNPNGKDKVNTVKKREWFRPYAGTVLHEKKDEWFDFYNKENFKSKTKYDLLKVASTMLLFRARIKKDGKDIRIPKWEQTFNLDVRDFIFSKELLEYFNEIQQVLLVFPA